MDVSAVEGTWATGDKQRIKQILTSLTDNALKFTTQGEIYIRVLLQKDHVHFEVQDSGIGIAPEKQSQIFQRFEQADLENKPPVWWRWTRLGHCRPFGEVHGRANWRTKQWKARRHFLV
jgi:light-regulated signal transduction histidine kinase (bacteriophytochrome)